MTILCRYSCHACGLIDAPVQVQARGVEDVIAWMNATIRTLAADHARRSPGCQPDALQHVKIPMPRSGIVGAPDES